MKSETITIRLSTRRMNKLRLLAVQQDKTMTQIIEDCLDKLPEPIGNSSETNIADHLVGQFVVAPNSSHTSRFG